MRARTSKGGVAAELIRAGRKAFGTSLPRASAFLRRVGEGVRVMESESESDVCTGSAGDAELGDLDVGASVCGSGDGESGEEGSEQDG